MEGNKLITYAIWLQSNCEGSDQKIEDGFWNLWDDIWRDWTFPIDMTINAKYQGDDNKFSPWIKVETGFYLLHTESHWSAGDVCGYLKGNHHINLGDQLIAVKIDQTSEISYQGLTDPEIGKNLNQWKDRGMHIHLERRPR
jgi:hypothetical protein